MLGNKGKMKMKNVILGLAVSAALVSGAASAADVTAEWRDASNGINQYKVEVTNTVGDLKLAAEAETTQAKGDGKVSQLFAAGVGYKVNYDGFSFTPFVQVVDNLNTNAADQRLLGVGLKVSHDLVGPLVADAEYRYRATFDGASSHENREKLAVTWNVTKQHAVGAAYYLYSGSSASNHREGVFYKYTF